MSDPRRFSAMRHQIERVQPNAMELKVLCTFLAAVFLLGQCSRSAEPVRPESQQLNVVVLSHGEVFQGPVKEEAFGYMVTLHNGQVFLPFDRVQAVGKTLQDAYQRMRHNLAAPTANDHIRLASWCVRHELLNEAQTELKSALALEPTRREALELLTRIEKRLRSGKDRSPNHERPEATSVGNEARRDHLSRESMSRYIGTIQPLLVNRCGNAACHGSASTNAFRIRHNRSSRAISLENLDHVLSFLDLSDPAKSPLWNIPAQEQPPHHRIFRGPSSARQRDLLKTWVLQVASEIAARQQGPAETRSLAVSSNPSELPETKSNIPLLVQPIPIPHSRGEFSQGNAVTGSPNQVDEAFLRSLIDQERPDPFDPKAFNRLVHGENATETTP